MGTTSACASGSDGPHIEVRADAVQPATDVDISVFVDERLAVRSTVAAATKLDIGHLPEGKRVRAIVRNARAAGTVRANILADNCFRASQSCAEAGCEAIAQYRVKEEVCINE